MNQHKIIELIDQLSSLLKQAQSQLTNLKASVHPSSSPLNKNDKHNQANEEHIKALSHSQAAAYHASIAANCHPNSSDFISHSGTAAYHASMSAQLSKLADHKKRNIIQHSQIIT